MLYLVMYAKGTALDENHFEKGSTWDSKNGQREVITSTNGGEARSVNEMNYVNTARGHTKYNTQA